MEQVVGIGVQRETRNSRTENYGRWRRAFSKAANMATSSSDTGRDSRENMAVRAGDLALRPLHTPIMNAQHGCFPA